MGFISILGPDVVRNDAFLPATTLMLKQLLLVMAECVVQPTESIARLGCACIRFVKRINDVFEIKK